MDPIEQKKAVPPIVSNCRPLQPHQNQTSARGRRQPPGRDLQLAEVGDVRAAAQVLVEALDLHHPDGPRQVRRQAPPPDARVVHGVLRDEDGHGDLGHDAVVGQALQCPQLGRQAGTWSRRASAGHATIVAPECKRHCGAGRDCNTKRRRHFKGAMLRVAKAAMKAGRKPNLNPGVCRTSRVQKAKKKNTITMSFSKQNVQQFFVKKKEDSPVVRKAGKTENFIRLMFHTQVFI